MFPGLGGMDPRQMKAMMKQLGIKSEDIPAKRVVIEAEGRKIIIDSPQVTAINMGGRKTYTIMGEEREEASVPEIPEADILMVAEQAGVSRENASAALGETKGDIAEAIEKLKK
ncbi:Nascent polypeptide-associated complex protein [uncultured archaeon]|nr:Nascent polypeptide-associated complex protein [uncultured archaeon]